MLQSAVGMAHVLRSGLVMGYTTSYFPLIVLGYTQKLTRSTLALKLSVSPSFYPWVTATLGSDFYASKAYFIWYSDGQGGMEWKN